MEKVLNIGMCAPLSDYEYYILMTTNGKGETMPNLIDVWLKIIGF